MTPLPLYRHFSDARLWDVLGDVELADAAAAAGGLTAAVAEDGANWSQGSPRRRRHYFQPTVSACCR